MLKRTLSWLHVGDLHARAEDRWAGVERLAAILDDLSGVVDASAVDFVFLPGDNANEGEPEQYARIRGALGSAAARIPFRIVPGDHDFVPGNLDAFRSFLRDLDIAAPPSALRINDRRAIFLDAVSGGAGGPAFDLSHEQLVWLKRELIEARADDAFAPVVFMHAFPGDFATSGGALAAMFAEAGVAIVDTGHTHYNEIINDGGVVYTAARSTAQIEEEGEEAYGAAFVAVDGDEASFRFRRAGSGWPFVMITSPADIRLQVRRTPLDDDGRLVVRAKIFGADANARVTLEILGREIAMTLVPGEASLWSATFPEPWQATLRALPPPDSLVTVTVRAQTAAGTGSDVIRLRPKVRTPPAGRSGTPGGPIGSWVEHGILGTRLGPNGYGKDW